MYVHSRSGHAGSTRFLRTAKPLTSALLVPAVAFLAPATRPALGQSVDDPARLAGLERVDIRAEAQWDELITRDVGGATPEQFLDALQMTFRESVTGANAAPSVVDGAPVTVTCHVDTFYDHPVIIYALRVQAEQNGVDGEPVITWIKSWVGSFTVQQLHLMFRLGDQCAESFLEDWRSVN
jgi:hypothetical protein